MICCGEPRNLTNCNAEFAELLAENRGRLPSDDYDDGSIQRANGETDSFTLPCSDTCKEATVSLGLANERKLCYIYDDMLSTAHTVLTVLTVEIQIRVLGQRRPRPRPNC